MIKRLRMKFILIVVAIVASMLAAIFGLVYESTRENLKNKSIQMMQTIAADPLGQNQTPARQEGVYLPYFCVMLDRSGLFIVRGSNQYALDNDDYVNAMMDLVLESQTSVGVIESQSLRFYRTQRSTATVMVFLDMSAESATLSGLARNFLLIGIGGTLAFSVLAFLLSVWMTKPVEEAWDQQQQFVADASHELKTPLTVILTNAELLQQAQGQEESQQLSANILTMSRQMRSLVERLLDLTRADNGVVQKSFAPLDLSQLVTEALLPFEPVYFERGLQLHSHLQENLWTQGSATHLKQVTDILLDNAAKYAASSSWVQVVLRRQGGNCLLSVATPGEPLSKEELKNIFKRFYRKDKTRNQRGSYGLGLSIAHAIVREHRGKIWAESSGSINTFHVLLPGRSAVDGKEFSET